MEHAQSTQKELLAIHIDNPSHFAPIIKALANKGYKSARGKKLNILQNITDATTITVKLNTISLNCVDLIAINTLLWNYEAKTYLLESSNIMDDESVSFSMDKLSHYQKIGFNHSALYLAIPISTFQKWVDILALCERMGIKWSSGDNALTLVRNWNEYKEKTYLLVRTIHHHSLLGFCDQGWIEENKEMVYLLDLIDLLKDEKEGGEETMTQTTKMQIIKKWMYARDEHGMTNLAKYIYKKFSKKLAKEYKACYFIDQSEKDIADIVLNAFITCHDHGRYYRTQAKNVVMNKRSLDINFWLTELGLVVDFMSGNIINRYYASQVMVDRKKRYIADTEWEAFREQYAYCENCHTYHLKSTTPMYKVYNYAAYEDDDLIKYTCQDFTKNNNYVLHKGVWTDKDLIKKDGLVAKREVLSYHSFNWGQEKAQAKSKGEKDNSLKMGIEIETYGNIANSAFVNKYDDHFHCESDSSLESGYSFEMISVPMTKRYWNSIRKSVIEPLFTTLKNHGHESGDEDYGLHVHIDKSAFKDLNSVKWFIHNVQLHQRDIQKMARRDSSHYYDYHTEDGIYPVEDITTSLLQQEFSSHNTCVNTHMYCGEIGDTIEIRVFKSTLDADTLYSTLKLVENLVRLANKHSTSKKTLLSGIENFAKKHRVCMVEE